MKTVRCLLPRTRWARRVEALISVVLLAGSAARADVVIDDFEANQAALTSNGGSTLSTSALGGERDLSLATSAGVVSLGATLGALHLEGDNDADGTAEIVWDGNDDDASELAVSGLGGQNLTAGDENALLLGIHSLAGSPTLTITIYSGVSASSVSLGGLTASSEPQLIRVPYSSFIGTATFASVGAIRLQVTGLPNAALVLDFVRTGSASDPSPLEGRMTDVVLVDSDGNGKASPGDRLRYVVTIRNTGASTLNSVQFAVTAPANTTLDATSVKAPPLARNDGASGSSAPGAAFHTPLNTALIVADGNSQDLMNNDFAGSPAAVITKFGSGTLGNTVDFNSAGSTATIGDHSLTVNANGSFAYTPAPGFTGLFTFEYRIANTVGSQTATVTIAVGTRPGAGTDAFAVTGNVQLDTATLAGLMDNDTGDALVISANSQPSNGSVSLLASGKFTYTPARGYAGSDSFTYTVGNGFGNVTGTVNLTVANMVWFVDGGAAAGGDGRSHTPYNTLAAFNIVNTAISGNPADNHVILIRDGSYGDGLTLRNGQKVVGDGWSGTIQDAAGFDWAAGSVVDPLSATDPVIAPTNGNGVNLAAGNAIRGLRVGNTPAGFGYVGGAVGSLVIAECSKTGSGGAMNITTSGAFGSSVSFDQLESTSSTGANLNLVGVTGTLAVISPEGGFSGSAAGAAALKNSGGSVTFAYSGGITKSNAGRLIDIQNQTGGTIALSGALTQNVGNGIHLANNTGAAINFTGAINLTTGANPAFTATGGGTVTATANGSTLTTTTGTALNVANTTIGAAGLRFQSITAGTAAGGPNNGIILNNTGTSGGLTVSGTGTGAVPSGGLIQRCTADAILLTSTFSVDLKGMKIQNGTESGIVGSTVTGLNLARVEITDNGNDSADDGIRIFNLLGGAVWTSVTVTGSAHNNVWIQNNSGTLSSLAISASNFSNNKPTFGNDGLLMDAVAPAVVSSVTLTGTTVSGNKATGIHVLANGGASGTSTIGNFQVSNCTIQNNNIAADFSTAGGANLNFALLTNANITGHSSHAINLNVGVPSSGIINGRIQGNSIGTLGVAKSGSEFGHGISIVGNSEANLVLLIDANTIRQCPEGRGISILGRNGGGQIDATITGNTVTPNDTTGFPLSAILVQSNLGGVAGYKVRSDIRNNVVPTGTAIDIGGGFITVWESNSASFSELVDSAPASANASAQLAQANTGSVSANAGVALIPGPISTVP